MLADSTSWQLPRNFHIQLHWFDHSSSIHGKGHTLRVMILAERLYAKTVEEGLPVTPNLYRNLMTAALIHDLARKHDSLCHEHGLWARNTKRLIAEEHFLGFALPDDDWHAIGEAVQAHSMRDPDIPYPQGSLSALLKDADGLDRVRLAYPPDTRYFRHPFTAGLLDLAWQLLLRDEDDLERELFSQECNNLHTNF
jgi:HD superfamily phosphodiesterase